MQVLYNTFKVLYAPKFPDSIRAFLVFILCGGCMASQLWCYKISFRLWTNYRPAYGTDPTVKKMSSNGTAVRKAAKNGRHVGIAADSSGTSSDGAQKDR